MVKMVIKPGVETPADLLRNNLREAEREVAWLLREKGEVLPLLRRLDAIAEGFETLEAEGLDLRPERTRWESLCAQMRRGIDRVARHAQEGQQVIQAAREEARAPRERWWWYLREEATQHRQRQVRQILRSGAIAAVVLIVLGILAYVFLRPDPLTAQKLRLYTAADRAIAEGRWDDAAARYQEAAAVDLSDPEPWLFLGWVQERQGNDQEARTSFQRAREAFSSPSTYELALARLYLEKGDLEKALPHALRATELDPESAQAFYALAGAYEGTDRVVEAIQAIQRAEELANAQGNLELAAMCRVRLGMLLQRISVPTP